MRLCCLVFLVGDLNAWTGNDAGWNGEEAVYTDVHFLEGWRGSACRRSAGSRGEDVIKLAHAAELRIVNGLRLEGSTLEAAGTATRALPDLELEDADAAGTVLDYVMRCNEH